HNMKNAILYILLIIGVFYFLINRGADESVRKGAKDILKSCQKEVAFSNFTHNEMLVKKAQKLLSSENYILISTLTKSEMMKSKISNYLAKENVDKVVARIIKKNAKAYSDYESSKKLTIKYNIIEADKHGLNKVNDGKTFTQGYLDFKFSIDEKMVYEARSDFIGRNGEDIPRRIECIINSLITL
ncbi:MAG: hypothetical protein J7L21_07370, partial [Sulfurimonas sp.]|nr:hypothetical protein [Sulfurimonas sp.]